MVSHGHGLGLTWTCLALGLADHSRLRHGLGWPVQVLGRPWSVLGWLKAGLTVVCAGLGDHWLS
jgi:hypothetical protein